jgi:hypothetical protein
MLDLGVYKWEVGNSVSGNKEENMIAVKKKKELKPLYLSSFLQTNSPLCLFSPICSNSHLNSDSAYACCSI